MPSAALFISVFEAVNILGSAFAVLKLLRSGLYRRYRIFFSYFLFRVPYMTYFLVLSNLKGLPGGNGSSSFLYFYSFLFTEPLNLLGYILVVIELYNLVLERYKGLSSLGRWAMYAALAISSTISLLTLLPKIGQSTPPDLRHLMYLVAAQRGVELALVVFILMIGWFLTRYPVPLSRNVTVHTAIYSIFFLCDALVLLWRTLLGLRVTTTFELISGGVQAACAVAWSLLLTAKGEEVRVHAPQLRDGSEERIMQQLEMLNSTLMKAGRKIG
jgi:hypothetical protein